ncbi:MAG: hypothetical protein ACRC7N_02925, partial [Clostridium sp.]
FRLDTNTTEKFKELESTLGLTQDKMLVDLISAFELEQAKQTLTDRGKEIEEFQDIAYRLIRIYTNSLELNKSTEERIKDKFTEQLIQKQDLITNLQEQVNKFKEDTKSKDTLLSITLDDNKKLKSELNNIKSIVETKETLVKEYVSKIDTLSSLVTEYSVYKDSIEDVKTDLDIEKKSSEALSYENKNLSLENDNLRKQIEVLQGRVEEYKDNIKTMKQEHKQDMVELKAEKENIISDNRKIIEDIHVKNSKEINEIRENNNNIIIGLKDDYKNEIKEIENRLDKKTQMEIYKVTIKYEKLLLESAAKIAVKDNKKSK